MFVSLAGSALDMRHPRVHVPAFTDSYLPVVTVSPKAGLYTYNRTGADASSLVSLRRDVREFLAPRMRTR